MCAGLDNGMQPKEEPGRRVDLKKSVLMMVAGGVSSPTPMHVRDDTGIRRRTSLVTWSSNVDRPWWREIIALMVRLQVVNDCNDGRRPNAVEADSIYVYWPRRLVVGRSKLLLSMESLTFACYCRFVLSASFFMLTVRTAFSVTGVLCNEHNWRRSSTRSTYVLLKTIKIILKWKQF